MKAVLMLEDGRSFSGEALAGAQGERIGEVIFNTAVVGYQEMMTDPANAGKILVLTYPLIGNYGVAPKFNESKQVWLSGLVIKEKSNIFSNWQAKRSFDDFVKEQKLLTLSEVDTRSLAVHLRQKGEILGIISTSCFEPKELKAKMEAFRRKSPASILPKISVARPSAFGKSKKGAKKIAVLDLGITNSIIKQLQTLGVSLTLLPYDSKAEAILKFKPKGLIISGGPESDPGLDAVAENIKLLIGKIPILGISCGHEVLTQSLGAKVVKMKLGHHGVNYPINNPASYKGEITVQNHSYAADAGALSKRKDIKITAYNLNDRTVEEMESKKLKFIGIQYCPSSPGFGRANDVFNRFLRMLERSK
jgi:carbamoyl-phosphate synthase small subunit